MKKPNKRPRGSALRKVRQHYGVRIVYLRIRRLYGPVSRSEWFLDAYTTTSCSNSLAEAHKEIFQP